MALALISVELLIAMGVKGSAADQWAKPLDDACNRYAINNTVLVSHFLAQVMEESNCLTHFKENLNYLSPARLVAVWDKRFTLQQHHANKRYAGDYVRNPKKLANFVYANRMGNGDEASGDGWRYLGIGPLMLTGKEMHEDYAHYSGNDILSNPELLAQPAVGADSAAWLFAVKKRLLDDAYRDDIEVITLKINGGYTNLDNRRHLLQVAKQYFKNQKPTVEQTAPLPTAAIKPEPAANDAPSPAVVMPLPTQASPMPIADGAANSSQMLEAVKPKQKAWHSGLKTHIYMFACALLGAAGLLGYVPGLSADTSAKLIEDALAVSGLRSAAPNLISAFIAYLQVRNRGSHYEYER